MTHQAARRIKTRGAGGRRFYKAVMAAVMVGLLGAVALVQPRLNRDRAELGLTAQAPLENAPPVLAFTTVALGGFRGLIANSLWIRASDLQLQGKYFEAVQLADWITKLQPRMTTVWSYQAWNMAYNISVKFTEPRDRWFWVQRGIELLRDQALVYNPRDPELYRALAWFYQHKIGHFLDDAHGYYKQALLNDMATVFGLERPDVKPLVEPQTEEDRARAQRLRERFRLEPARMQRVDEAYGPLDWRMPESHAIYWAAAGLEVAPPQRTLPLKRVIYQSLQLAFLRGRYIPNHAQRTFEVGPNLDVAPKLNAVFASMMAEDPEHREVMNAAYRNFLRQATYLFYVHNRPAAAAQWFTTLRSEYPDAAAPGTTLEQFVVERVSEQLGQVSMDRTRAIIQGFLTTSFTHLALGETEYAAGLERLSQTVWQHYQQRFAAQEQRAGLPPLSRMKQEVLDRLLDPEHGLHPQLQAQLRTALGLPAARPPAPERP